VFDQIALGGIGFAVLAAAAYGFAGVAIAQGKPVARGDNGVYLSALVTALGTGLLWMGFGRVQLARLLDPGSVGTVAIFAAAGVFSTVLGRATLYRATERIGAVRASLLRRLTPVFTLPLALLLLAEVPGPRALVGAAIVLVAVLIYQGGPGREVWDRAGFWIGIGSAAVYASAYVLRRLGLETLPDPLLGTFIGAIVGCLWFPLAALAGRARGARLRRLLADRGRWQWAAAGALAVGQVCQFAALAAIPAVVVACLGTLEVFFAALLWGLFGHGLSVAPARFAFTLILAAGGTVLLLD